MAYDFLKLPEGTDLSRSIGPEYMDEDQYRLLEERPEEHFLAWLSCGDPEQEGLELLHVVVSDDDDGPVPIITYVATLAWRALNSTRLSGYRPALMDAVGQPETGFPAYRREMAGKLLDWPEASRTMADALVALGIAEPIGSLPMAALGSKESFELPLLRFEGFLYEDAGFVANLVGEVHELIRDIDLDEDEQAVREKLFTALRTPIRDLAAGYPEMTVAELAARMDALYGRVEI